MRCLVHLVDKHRSCAGSIDFTVQGQVLTKEAV